jgi:hypothetical protein
LGLKNIARGDTGFLCLPGCFPSTGDHIPAVCPRESKLEREPLMLMWSTRVIVVNLELVVSVSMAAGSGAISEVNPIAVVVVLGRLVGATLI